MSRQDVIAELHRRADECDGFAKDEHQQVMLGKAAGLREAAILIAEAVLSGLTHQGRGGSDE